MSYTKLTLEINKIINSTCIQMYEDNSIFGTISDRIINSEIPIKRIK